MAAPRAFSWALKMGCQQKCKLSLSLSEAICPLGRTAFFLLGMLFRIYVVTAEQVLDGN